MSTIQSTKETIIKQDANGNITKDTIEKTKKIEKLSEPDYIKIYTNMWCEFNQIPEKWRGLFLQLAARMSWCRFSSENDDGGQIVYTGKPNGDDICRSLNWEVSTKTNSQLMKGLKELCKCNAIRKVNRGVYQINPAYAARGEWKYNPRANRGGVEDLIAIFNFKDKKVKTNIIWADDGTDNELNKIYREGLNIKPEEKENIVIKSQTIQKDEK